MIEIVKTDKGKLEQEVWRFDIINERSNGIYLVLNSFQEQTRPTRRHKWRVNVSYYRLDGGGEYSSPNSTMKNTDNLCIPTDIKEMAIKAVKVVVVKDYPR